MKTTWELQIWWKTSCKPSVSMLFRRCSDVVSSLCHLCVIPSVCHSVQPRGWRLVPWTAHQELQICHLRDAGPKYLTGLSNDSYDSAMWVSAYLMISWDFAIISSLSSELCECSEETAFQHPITSFASALVFNSSPASNFSRSDFAKPQGSCSQK